MTRPPAPSLRQWRGGTRGARLSPSAWAIPRGALVEPARDGESAGCGARRAGDRVVHPVGRGSAPPNPGGPRRSHSPGTAVLDERTPLADPLAALAAVAGAAGTTGPATAVPFAVLRRPHLGARAVATLHEVSGGRLRPGAGAGRPQGEFAALGAPFATRGRDLDDEIAVLRRVFAGGPFDDRPDRWVFAPVRVGVAEAARGRAAIREIRQVPGWTGPFMYILRVDAVDHGQVAEFATKRFDEAIVWAYQLRGAGAVNERRHTLTEALSHMRCARERRHVGVASIYRYEFLRECPRHASGPGGGTSDKVQANSEG